MASRDLSKSTLPHKIQASQIAYMRLFAGLPGMVMEDGDTFWFVSHRDAPGNCILRTTWGGGDVEARVDALLADVARVIDEIDWTVFPGDQPADLGSRLAARGMPCGRSGGAYLYARLKDLHPASALPDKFHIERVRDARMMAAWVQVSEAGFEEELGQFYDAYLRYGFTADADAQPYIGYLGDVPVTSATLLDAGGAAAIYDVSTPPKYRWQGFGGAITRALLMEMRRRGYLETWLWSTDMGKSVYEKLGFVEADFGICTYHWKQGR